MNQFIRTEMLFGVEAIAKLARSRVAVFGLGGVGGYVVEALARSGIGALDLVDNDTVSLSNLNRQILATHKTIGMAKTKVAAERVAEINPACIVRIYDTFFLPENASEFDFGQYDYVVDAIDTVSGKIGLVLAAQNAGVPIISAMGTGNKQNPAMFKVADIYKTAVCPLAHVMRKELRRRGVKHLKVVYSEEMPLKPADNSEVEVENTKRRATPGSTAFVPPVAGMIMAAEVVHDLCGL
ncbi:MAG: tRNA threonylcarbamoyladenosine dehydratase [Alphaproteobacteria bacterium]|nr:tRNA threonylcarbamoyladenosine dehydratase [Alphaproteobacteria bacterium]